MYSSLCYTAALRLPPPQHLHVNKAAIALNIPTIQRVIPEIIVWKKPAIALTTLEIREAIEFTIPLRQENTDPIIIFFFIFVCLIYNRYAYNPL